MSKDDEEHYEHGAGWWPGGNNPARPHNGRHRKRSGFRIPGCDVVLAPVAIPAVVALGLWLRRKV